MSLVWMDDGGWRSKKWGMKGRYILCLVWRYHRLMMRNWMPAEKHSPPKKWRRLPKQATPPFNGRAHTSKISKFNFTQWQTFEILGIQHHLSNNINHMEVALLTIPILSPLFLFLTSKIHEFVSDWVWGFKCVVSRRSGRASSLSSNLLA